MQFCSAVFPRHIRSRVLIISKVNSNKRALTVSQHQSSLEYLWTFPVWYFLFHDQPPLLVIVFIINTQFVKKCYSYSVCDVHFVIIFYRFPLGRRKVESSKQNRKKWTTKQRFFAITQFEAQRRVHLDPKIPSSWKEKYFQQWIISSLVQPLPGKFDS